MGGFFSEQTLEQVRAASDIVEIIGASLPLKRAGANFVTLGLAGVGLLGSPLVGTAAAGVAPFRRDGLWRVRTAPWLELGGVPNHLHRGPHMDSRICDGRTSAG